MIITIIIIAVETAAMEAVAIEAAVTMTITILTMTITMSITMSRHYVGDCEGNYGNGSGTVGQWDNGQWGNKHIFTSQQDYTNLTFKKLVLLLYTPRSLITGLYCIHKGYCCG